MAGFSINPFRTIVNVHWPSGIYVAVDAILTNSFTIEANIGSCDPALNEIEGDNSNSRMDSLKFYYEISATHVANAAGEWSPAKNVVLSGWPTASSTFSFGDIMDPLRDVGAGVDAGTDSMNSQRFTPDSEYSGAELELPLHPSGGGAKFKAGATIQAEGFGNPATGGRGCNLGNIVFPVSTITDPASWIVVQTDPVAAGAVTLDGVACSLIGAYTGSQLRPVTGSIDKNCPQSVLMLFQKDGS